MEAGDLFAGRFEIVSFANAGAHGAVYRAKDCVTGRAAALKILHGGDPAYADLLTRETMVLKELRHPAIVEYIADGRTPEGVLWLAMEWLEGVDLEAFLRRGPMALRDAVAMGVQAARALGAAHARGVIHRDVKPSNIFLRSGDLERVALVDFGVARTWQATRPTTRAGSIFGTPGYMAPEQALGAKDLDARADVFALGCVLFECLTGRPAFEGEHLMVVLAKILVGDAPHPAELRPEVPEALDRLVVRMLSKAPESRPAHASAVADELEEIAALPPSAPRSLRSPTPAAPVTLSAEVLASPAPEPRSFASMPLLRSTTPCVGRERELGALEAVFGECVGEPVARAVLVTGPPGAGKSRLVHEFLRRLTERNEPVEIWVGRGDPMAVSSPFGVLGQAIRGATGIRAGEELSMRKERLLTRISRRIEGADLGRVTQFVGELVATQFPDHVDPPLRAARQDARLMGDQIRRAWEDWLSAECAAGPLLLVIEDLEWCDRPSLDFAERALEHLADLPLLVIATGTPEAVELLPSLRASEAAQVIRLPELAKKASERLARHVLGAGADKDAVAAVVDGCGGSPLLLEELLRAAVERREPPKEAALSIRARIAGLHADARRVLAAASTFGDTFWEGGVHALLKSGTITSHLAVLVSVRQWLAELVDLELLARRGARRFANQEEYAFRHPLVREVAYASLQPEERALYHLRAAEWLARAGESDPGPMVEHFERAGDRPSAAGWCVLAAELSLEGTDFEGVIHWARHGAAAGATGELLGTLRLLQSEAHKHRGEPRLALECALDARRLFPRGGPYWYSAIGEVAHLSNTLGDHARLAEAFDDLYALTPAAWAPHVIAMARLALQLLQAGLHEHALRAYEYVEEVDPAVWERDPEVSASIHRARAFRAMVAGDAGRSVDEFELAARSFERVGDLRNTCVQRVNVGYATNELGAFEYAENALRDALAAAERMKLHSLAGLARHNLGLTLARQGKIDEARRVEADAVAAFVKQGDRRLEGASRIFLATILSLAGDLDAAEREARAAISVLAMHPGVRVYALARLSEVLLRKGDAAAALPLAEEAMGMLEHLGGVEEGESLVRLAYAEALEANGRHERARAAITAAHQRLTVRAARITDPDWRQCFLGLVPENARTMELSRAWACEVVDG